jgi:kynureninase
MLAPNFGVWQSDGVIDRTDALALDAQDPLARWRDEFVIPDPDLIYLDGNSLGRTPKRTVEALHRVVDQWAGDLISSWWEHDWLSLALAVGDELAPLLGAGPGEVAVHESTTVGIFQQVNVALDLSRDLSRDAAGDDGRRRVIAVATPTSPPTGTWSKASPGCATSTSGAASTTSTVSTSCCGRSSTTARRR